MCSSIILILCIRMGGFFSKCSPKHSSMEITSQIIQMKGKRDELEECRARIVNRIKDLEETILKHVKANERQLALLCLRKKALLSKHLSTVDNYLYQVLRVISDAEMAQASVIWCIVAYTGDVMIVELPFHFLV